MIVDDLDVVGVPVLPDEAHTPLIIDPDALLTFPAPPQCFELISGRIPQVIELNRRIESTQRLSR